MYKITKEFHFEAAHLLNFHKGLCKNLHGHSYKLYVTVQSQKLNEESMVVDFSLLKKIVEDIIIKKFDHSCIINNNTKDLFELELKNLLIKYNNN